MALHLRQPNNIPLRRLVPQLEVYYLSPGEVAAPVIDLEGIESVIAACSESFQCSIMKFYDYEQT